MGHSCTVIGRTASHNAMANPPIPTSLPAPREFTTTRWSVVLLASQGDAQQARAALEQLCSDYWYPLYAYVRRRGYGTEDAADLTQDFFAKLLANDFTRNVAPNGGRFRSFLLRSLDRFLIDEWRKGKSQKRGGNTFIESLESMISAQGESCYIGEPAAAETPEHLFQRAWAETLFRRVLQRLAVEFAERSNVRFEVIEPFLSLDGEPASLADAATALGLTLPAFKSVLHRSRQRYRELLLEEVGQTVGSSGDIDDELRGLLQALRGT